MPPNEPDESREMQHDRRAFVGGDEDTAQGLPCSPFCKDRNWLGRVEAHEGLHRERLRFQHRGRRQAGGSDERKRGENEYRERYMRIRFFRATIRS
jgi:hypothetical protein